MNLPFTVEQFLYVFGRYNEWVAPAQWLLYALALAAVWFTVRSARLSAKLVCLILSLLWLWAGVVYHLTFFTTINGAAYLFGALFIAQAGIVFWAGVWRSRLSFRPRPNARGVSGAVLISAALFIYPALSYLTGHRYPATPTFGLPCPTIIFTLGLLLWSEKPTPFYVLLIPMLWASIGLVAALRLGMTEDYLLLLALALGSLLLHRERAPTVYRVQRIPADPWRR